MTDAPADTATDTTDAPTDAPDTDTTDWKAEAEKYQALQRKWEDRAKSNAGAQKELDELRKASMSDLERAVAEARAEARADALNEAGAKIARAEFKAAAGDRLDAEGLEALLSSLDLKAFLDENGDVDAAKIAGFVDRIAPGKSEPSLRFDTVDLGQGSRTTSNVALNSDELLKAVMDKVGPGRR